MFLNTSGKGNLPRGKEKRKARIDHASGLEAQPAQGLEHPSSHWKYHISSIQDAFLLTFATLKLRPHLTNGWHDVRMVTLTICGALGPSDKGEPVSRGLAL